MYAVAYWCASDKMWKVFCLCGNILTARRMMGVYERDDPGNDYTLIQLTLSGLIEPPTK